MPLTPSTGCDITGTVRLMTLAGSTTGRRFTLVALLALTMAAGTFIVPAVGVLASSIRQDLGLEPWQLGLLVTGSPLVGALLAPALGRVTRPDRWETIDCRHLGGGGADARPLCRKPDLRDPPGSRDVYRGEPGMGKLGDQQGDLGEATPGRRGVVGIKQSGVQFGAFLAGLALRWRWPWGGVGRCWQPHDPAAGDLLAAVFVPTAPGPISGRRRATTTATG